MNWWQQRMQWRRLFNAATSMCCPIKRGCSALLLTFSAATQASLLEAYTDPTAPLAGKLWSTQSQQFVSLESVLDTLPLGSWLLLGETHENMDHHQLQANIIKYLADRARLGNVGLEMAHSEQQALLDRAQSGELAIAPEQLAWQPGWPWEWYEAPVTAALESAKRVIAGDLTRDEKLQAFRAEDLKISASPDYEEFMLELLFESHCQQMPKSQLGNMMNVQYARDKAMLDAMAANTASDAINLFLAGTVHARDDLGIPYWQPEFNPTTLLMIAAQTSLEPLDYYPDSYTETPAADYLLFTPSYKYESGCN